jgi:DNA (cytosine-5)-methyltransferase 1
VRAISLFAGIGGFDLALERSGFEMVAHVERDSSCRKLLASKFPKARVFDDVCAVGNWNLPPCDVLCGGWPCQDLSVAGKRAGLSGERSGLFYQFLRIADELQPSFLLWENVPGLLSSDDGRDFARVLVSLGERGYFGACRVLDSQYLGLAQRRRRVFGVFARGDSGARRAAEILSLSEGLRGHPAPRREAGKTVAGTLGGCSQSGGFRTTDLDNNGAFVVGALNPGAHPGGFNGQDAYTGHLIARTLRADGFDASEDGTGRGTPLAVVPHTLRGHSDYGEGKPCLRADGGDCGGGSEALVSVHAIQAGATRENPSSEEICPTLSGSDAGATSDMRPVVAVSFHENQRGELTTNDTAGSLKVGGGKPGQGYPAISVRSSVRRLTPRECERLQGFPDDWTAGFSDSTRYKMLGNAVSVPVVEWIARRLHREMTK